MKPFSICIATPCYNGVVTSQYAGSLADLTSSWSTGQREVQFGIHFIANESQIHRARNKCAAYARARDFTHLLFIDADLGFKVSDVMKLLDAEKRIIGGTYPVKKLPVKLNYNAVHGEVPDAEGILRARHVPTGFLLIDVTVFDRLESFADVCMKTDLTTGETYRYQEFFVPGIFDGEDLSEDWNFCRIAQAAGEVTYLHTRVVLPHVGTFEYCVDTHAESKKENE